MKAILSNDELLEMARGNVKYYEDMLKEDQAQFGVAETNLLRTKSQLEHVRQHLEYFEEKLKGN